MSEAAGATFGVGADEDAIRFLKVFSFLTPEEIEDVAREHFASPGARIGQKKVAYEVTKDLHGEEAANEAIKMTQALFSGDVSSLKQEQIEELFGEMKVKLAEGMNLLDALVAVKEASSKSEARRDVTQNAVSLNGRKVTDPTLVLTAENALYGKYLIFRKGKKSYFLGEF